MPEFLSRKTRSFQCGSGYSTVREMRKIGYRVPEHWCSSEFNTGKMISPSVTGSLPKHEHCKYYIPKLNNMISKIILVAKPFTFKNIVKKNTIILSRNKGICIGTLTTFHQKLLSNTTKTNSYQEAETSYIIIYTWNNVIKTNEATPTQMQMYFLTHLSPVNIFHHKTQTVFCLEGIFQGLEIKKKKCL